MLVRNLRRSLPLLLAGLLVACQSSAPSASPAPTPDPDPTPMEAARQSGWNAYGAVDRDQGPTIELAELKGDEANVILRGTITEVCPKKGCWMRVKDGADDVFVRFQDYGFFVPKNAAGHEVVMHGTAVKQVTSVEELRHYAQDEGKTDAEIAAIDEPKEQVTFFADAVLIAGDGLEPPHGE